MATRHQGIGEPPDQAMLLFSLEKEHQTDRQDSIEGSVKEP
jgi:hypothetical protein